MPDFMYTTYPRITKPELTRSNFILYNDGFSFTVRTEIEALRQANQFRGDDIKTVAVSPTPDLSGWIVHVFKK